MATTIRIETSIAAPPSVCFDLARDVTVHARTADFSHERVASPGRLEGLLQEGEVVTFEGRHFAVRQRLTARIVELNRPQRFVDEMIAGAFKRLRHTHEFFEEAGGTLMVDILEWESPWGLVGKLFDALLLSRHMQQFMRRKQARLKELAEGEVR